MTPRVETDQPCRVCGGVDSSVARFRDKAHLVPVRLPVLVYQIAEPELRCRHMAARFVMRINGDEKVSNAGFALGDLAGRLQNREEPELSPRIRNTEDANALVLIWGG